MKIVKLTTVGVALFAASLLAPQISAAADTMHQPGQGWDSFRSGDIRGGSGEMLSSQAYTGTAMGRAGQGWDVFNARSGDEEPLPSRDARYQGTSAGSAGQGWDVFRSGEGETI